MFEIKNLNKVNKHRLTDKYGRLIDYLRLSVTDLCNLRCTYCMPHGILDKTLRHDILSWEEIIRAVNIFADLGIKKVRLTGGEPFVRKGLMDFLPKICSIPNIEGVYITTNGTSINEYIPILKQSCIKGINISIDSLDPDIYHKITGHDSFNSVYTAIINLIGNSIPVKINVVVSKEIDEKLIIQMAYFAKENPVDIRFIELMPFRGTEESYIKYLDAKQILGILKSEFKEMIHFNSVQSTAEIYNITGFKGRIGIIPGHSRTFCSECNRIRLTAKGAIKNCLYGEEILDLKSLFRNSQTDDIIKNEIIKAVQLKYIDGFEAFANKNKSYYESMASIGG
jgi:molybdenum cofactor biosynthesis protein A